MLIVMKFSFSSSSTTQENLPLQNTFFKWIFVQESVTRAPLSLGVWSRDLHSTLCSPLLSLLWSQHGYRSPRAVPVSICPPWHAYYYIPVGQGSYYLNFCHFCFIPWWHNRTCYPKFLDQSNLLSSDYLDSGTIHVHYSTSHHEYSLPVWLMHNSF